jgi:hypothetical protein
MESRGLYYLREQTGVADAGYILELTSELVEKFSDAPDFARSSEVIRTSTYGFA